MSAQRQSTGLDRLRERFEHRWRPLARARETTLALRANLAESLLRVIPDDTSLVTFGSLARQEYTLGSDIDWTLLVDGQADPCHFTVAQAIRSDTLNRVRTGTQ